jgi:hypothetical protein
MVESKPESKVHFSENCCSLYSTKRKTFSYLGRNRSKLNGDSWPEKGLFRPKKSEKLDFKTV